MALMNDDPLRNPMPRAKVAFPSAANENDRKKKNGSDKQRNNEM